MSIHSNKYSRTGAVFFKSSFDEVHKNFHSSPAPDITWYKDGIKINTSNSDVDISQVSKLSITDFNKSLQGQYMCSLNNSEGNDNSTTSLRLVGKSRTAFMCCFRKLVFVRWAENNRKEFMVITCSKLSIKTPERRHWRSWHSSGVFIVNFEHILYRALVFLLLTLNMYLPPG